MAEKKALNCYKKREVTAQPKNKKKKETKNPSKKEKKQTKITNIKENEEKISRCWYHGRTK